MLFVGTLRSLSTCISTYMLDQRISLECFHVRGPVRNLSVSAATAKTWKKRHFSFINSHSLKLRILTTSANIQTCTCTCKCTSYSAQGAWKNPSLPPDQRLCTLRQFHMHNIHVYIHVHVHAHVHGTCQRMRERGWESGLQVCSDGNMAPRQRY